jgi:monoamine oxidase
MKPGSVIVNSPVDSITQYDNGTVVTTSTGNCIKARKVILAIPTNAYGYIQFSPPLPPAKKALVSRTMPGIYAKVIVTYRKPWWKELGLVGKFTSLKGPICFSWDISEASLQQYSLAFFVAGQRATKWHKLSSLAREEAIINHLAELVGPENHHLAYDVLEINAIEWTKEEFIFGAPTSAMGPKQLSQYGSALRESFINIHFGGGETAYEWKGYLEGAIGAGERAAAEVIDLLKSPANEKL